MSDQRFLSTVMLCGMIVLSGLIYQWTADMTPGAELFPRIMAGGLVLFAMVELGRTVFAERKANTADASSELVRKSTIFIGAFFLLVILFFVLFPVIGFEITAVTFMIASMWLLGGSTALRQWYVALLLPAALILIFRFGLSVRLPTLPFLE